MQQNNAYLEVLKSEIYSAFITLFVFVFILVAAHSVGVILTALITLFVIVCITVDTDIQAEGDSAFITFVILVSILVRAGDVLAVGVICITLIAFTIFPNDILSASTVTPNFSISSDIPEASCINLCISVFVPPYTYYRKSFLSPTSIHLSFV